MKNKRLKFAGSIFLLSMLIAGVAGHFSSSKIFAQPTDSMLDEIETLQKQLADQSRTQRTREDAAKLLLGKNSDAVTKILAKFLADPSNPGAQIAIANAISEIGGAKPTFEAPLLEMLNSEDQKVSLAAARALVTFRVDALLTVAKNSKAPLTIRLTVIKALARVVSKKSIAMLIDLLGDKNKSVRAAALGSLRGLTGIRNFGANQFLWKRWWDRSKNLGDYKWLLAMTDLVVKGKIALENENSSLRARLVKTMRDVYDATPKEQKSAILLKMLGDSISDIRLLGTSLVASKIIANEDLSPKIRKRLQLMLTDEDPQVRKAITLLEAQVPDKSTVDTLIRRLSREAHPSVRVAIIQALGHIADQRAFYAVLKQVQNEDEAQAQAAAIAIGQIIEAGKTTKKMQSKAFKTLYVKYQKASAGKNAINLKEALLNTLAIVNDSAAITVLENALSDQAGVIRLAAVSGLTKMNASKSSSKISKLLEDSDRGVRQAVISALAKLSGKDYLIHILKRTDIEVESDATVRKEAAQWVTTLVKSADLKTQQRLLKQLTKQKNPTLRVEVLQIYIQALRDRNHKSLPQALENFSKDLLTAGRAEEAADALKEGYSLMLNNKSATNSQILTYWQAYINALIQANDPQVAKLIARQANKKVRNASIQLYANRLERLLKRKEYQTVETLAKQARANNLAIAKWGEPQIAELIRKARNAQQELDEALITKLLPALISPDDSIRKNSQTQIKGLGKRAVKPLIKQLRVTISATRPDTKLELAIWKLIVQLDPKLTGYDPKLKLKKKLAKIKTWLKSIE